MLDSMERGTVVAFNAGNQKIAIAVDGNHCALFELTDDCAVAVGQRVCGDLESRVCFALENLSTGQMLSVIPQGLHLSVAAAKQAVAE